MRVKICGITRAEDGVLAAEAGADAIGVNFVGGPRQINPATAAEIVTALPAMVTPVALVNLIDGQVPADHLEWLGTHWVSHVQLYGDVDAAAVQRIRRDGLRPMVVCRVKGADFAEEVNELLDGCGSEGPAAVVLDAYDKTKAGGTGEAFNWTWVREAADRGQLDDWPAIVLAGGLTAENVGEAIAAVRPWAVDVSSGVEGAPGEKDVGKVSAFMQAVKRG